MGLNGIKTAVVIGQNQSLIRNHFSRAEAPKVHHRIIKAAGTPFGVNIAPGHLHAHGFHLVILSRSIFWEPHSLP